RTIHVESEPAGAEVTVIDGAERRALGTAPLDATLPAGRAYQLELGLGGYVTARQPVAAGAKDATVRVALERAAARKGKLSLTSSPAGAVVFDASGHRRGVTPYRVEIDRDGAAHAFELRCLGYLNSRLELSAATPSRAVTLTRDRSVPPAS